MMFDPLQNHRILLIDDSLETHGLFRRILLGYSDLPNKQGPRRVVKADSDMPAFEIDSAYQGQEGLALIEKSLLEKKPYAMAFVDVRMPPGWDGLETICKIWEKYPDLLVVICTGYIEQPWNEIARKLGYLDRVVILHKPFDKNEVLQLAVSMSLKWRLNQQAKLRVDNLERLVLNLYETQ
jgi:CheY-like chemotaxis protein